MKTSESIGYIVIYSPALFLVVLLMEEILHHLGDLKKQIMGDKWDKLHINCCRISWINSICLVLLTTCFNFHYYLGKMISILMSIFCRWVGEKPPTSGIFMYFSDVRTLGIRNFHIEASSWIASPAA